MVTLNDKISLLLDVNELFDLQSENVNDVLYGDTYKIESTYIEMLNFVRDNVNVKFTHTMSGEIKSLKQWIDMYQFDISDDKSVTIFLRSMIYLLIR